MVKNLPLQAPKWLHGSGLRLIALKIGAEQATFSHFELDSIFLKVAQLIS